LLIEYLTLICDFHTIVFYLPRVIWLQRKFIQLYGGYIVMDYFPATLCFMDMLARNLQLMNSGKNATST